MEKIDFENIFPKKISKFLEPTFFQKKIFEKVMKNENFENPKNIFSKFRNFQFSFLFRRIFFGPKNFEKISGKYFSKINFLHEN